MFPIVPAFSRYLCPWSHRRSFLFPYACLRGVTRITPLCHLLLTADNVVHHPHCSYWGLTESLWMLVWPVTGTTLTFPGNHTQSFSHTKWTLGWKKSMEVGEGSGMLLSLVSSRNQHTTGQALAKVPPERNTEKKMVRNTIIRLCVLATIYKNTHKGAMADNNRNFHAHFLRL